MDNVQRAPYGSWKSPITADLIVSGTIGLGMVRADGSDVYWLESRPTEGGRTVLVCMGAGGAIEDVSPSGSNVRSRVHEYGGGAYAVKDGVVYFVNFPDQVLYRLEQAEQSVAMVSGSSYADLAIDPHQRYLICVREEHREDEVINALIRIELDTATVLVSGADFYASPRFSSDGNRLAWLSWNHPNMPWDGTELWVADVLADGSVGQPVLVAGGAQESIFQPEWSPDGTLHFISDRSGWWNLYAWEGNEVQALYAREAEFGLPQWVFGVSTYAFISEGRILCTYREKGLTRLGVLDKHSGAFRTIELPYTELSGPAIVPGGAVLVAASPTEPAAVIRLDLESGVHRVLRTSSHLPVDAGYLCRPESLTFTTTDSQIAYGYYYPPCNQDFIGLPGEKPPLLVKSHGGPTAATSSALNLKIQYWTSRGFAVLDVNYRGSTGYGRAYREQLKGRWGIADVDDCVQGALFLVARGDVDGGRLAIDGSSAGGYTTLCALAFRDVFKAGASYYGVSDLKSLARDTHKFEARYFDGLIGPYPECQALYIARSPIHSLDQLACPVIFLQGLEDRVVPPNQAEAMVEALRIKGLPVAYLAFEGEQHGFRRAENIKRALEAEFYFFARIFGFAPADIIEPVPIDNLRD
ncbi:S9 family peptidase [Gloeobacter morelensis]|uniref:S9 family peptidase n=1 Tax=Gloeobacter morelensis MG652769 TaxID=2781736 RepID=A0ABY3PKW5_9CYAN|nr:S9 family peptidase [Gloeobacter morelensis]UFP94322.1 S9 family peptidase [Gloeobacter morelensis MG652769]